MTNSTAGATTTSASGREWIGLAMLGLAARAVAIDGFVLLLALPTIGEGLPVPLLVMACSLQDR